MQFVAASQYAQLVCQYLVDKNKWATLPMDDTYLVRAVMFALGSLLAPTTPNVNVDPDKVKLRPVRPAELPNVIRKTNDSMQPGHISITFLGEDHRYAPDQARAQGFISALGAANMPDVLIVERGMNYDLGTISYMREENIETSNNAPGQFLYDQRNPGNWGLGLTAAQRSYVVAGYAVLCMYTRSSTGYNSMGIVFGANHQDIINAIEYLIKNVGVHRLASTRRTYVHADSLLVQPSSSSKGGHGHGHGHRRHA
jgi:hypothetical protein